MNFIPPPRERGTFTYRVYGLGVWSALPLPELTPDRGRVDLRIELGCVPAPKEASAVQMSRPHVTGDGVILSFPNVGRFLAREGRRIVIEPEPGVEERVLRLFLLGAGLGVALHQRGRFVLHASAVEVGGGAVAFLAASGGGKSTLAAAMHKRGHALVADDVLALDAGGSTLPKAYPGFPQLKLWPEAVRALGDALENLPHVRPGMDKRAQLVADRFAARSLRMKRIYVLAKAAESKIEPLRASDAMLELIRYSYCTRLLQSIGREEHFRQCANVANRVGVRRLNVKRSLARLPELAQLVEDDLANNP